MKITVSTTIDASITSVWRAWNNPADIKKWNAASEDWHTTECTVDLTVGGKFNARMEAKDKSAGFNLVGEYTQIVYHKLIEYVLEDGRKVSVEFKNLSELTQINQSFKAEEENNIEMQRNGWQSILNNFAKYVEAKA